MIKGINYWAFPVSQDGNLIDPKAAMRRAKDLGYDSFELTVDRNGPFNLNSTKQEADALRKEAERIGIQLPTVCSALSWQESPTSPDPEIRHKAVLNTAKIIELAAILGAGTVLYVPGMVSAGFAPEFVPQRYDQVENWAREAIMKLLPVAERNQVRIGIENVWNRFLLNPVEMRNFIDSFHSPWVGSYFDVGNVMLYGHPEHWIEILGTRILAVHMKDFRVNVGNLDGFVDLLSGDVNFAQVMSAFKNIGYTGPYTAEILPGITGSVEKAVVALGIIESIDLQGPYINRNNAAVFP
jgi:L-ribulose-5-phosphate 3-epimerase